MYPDVLELHAFYESPLGLVAQRTIRRRLRAVWPDVRGDRVLGLGFPTPFLRPLRAEAERVFGLMPSRQGVMHWPAGARSLTGLVDEGMLPLPDASVDRVVLAHALENSEHGAAFLREVWRVMAASGRLLVIVPNRRGLWARFETTPFGHGRPFSRAQLQRLLDDALFEPETWATALFMPPSGRRILLRAAPAMERAGERWWPRFAGLHIVEASKRMYLPATGKSARGLKKPVLVAPGLAPSMRSRAPARFAG